MKKLFLSLVILASAMSAFAQKNDADGDFDRRANIRDARKEVVSQQKTMTPSAVSAADVGEPDSFGKNVKFLGTALSGFVYFYSSCDPAVLLTDLELTLGPDDRCVVIGTPGQSVGQTFNDIGRITIPAKSVDNVIFFVGNNLIDSEMFNPNVNMGFKQFSYSPTITIESTALNDPAAIDPATGLPMNGSYTTGINATKSTFKSIQPNETDIDIQRYASTSTIGLSRTFFANLGLPQNVINKLYNRQMTIRLNLRVRGNYFQFGQFNYAMRFFGN